MKTRHAARLLLCFALFGASGSAFAQADKSMQHLDLKPLLPPIVPPVLPPNSLLTPGTVGGPQPPTSGSLHDREQSTLPAPGIRLTIPTR